MDKDDSYTKTYLYTTFCRQMHSAPASRLSALPVLSKNKHDHLRPSAGRSWPKGNEGERKLTSPSKNPLLAARIVRPLARG